MRLRSSVKVGVLLAVSLLGGTAVVSTAEILEAPATTLAASPHPLASAGSAESSGPTPNRDVVRTIAIGRSVRGRTITASEVRNSSSHDTILVVGCIHGDECAGIPVARDLRTDPPSDRLNLWIVPDMNPDGRLSGTRQNAHGVDLNRNFPFRWRPLGSPGAWDYSGPRPLSEPESRAMRSFIRKVRPGITIWFHEPAVLVDRSGGRLSIERRYARLVGLPLGRFPRYPGSAIGWENHAIPGGTAFDVELPPGRLSKAAVERYADAVLRLT